MVSVAHSTIDRLRRPEYTGENRCLPCTGVNLLIAGSVAIAVGSASVEAGLLVFIVTVTAIWLRGYLIPGTPELTKRYLPDRILTLFGKSRVTNAGNGPNPEAYLIDSEVLVETPDGADYSFAPWFESAWWTHLTATSGTSTDAEALADLTGLDEETLSVSWRGDAFFALVDDERIAHWESRAAFLADVASDRALAAHRDDWLGLPLSSRSAILGALRLFVESCPSCEGPVALEEDVVESCCRRYEVVAGTCTTCSARLFEIDVPPFRDSESN